MDYQALVLTLQLASATTLILLTIAIPTAWWIAQRRGILPALIQAMIALPLVLPPTVIGFYLLVGFGPLTGFGRLITRLIGHPLAFSFAGLLVGSVIYSLPFAIQPLVAGFAAIDLGFLESAASLGMRPLSVFGRVALPMIATSLLTSAVLTFTHTLGEFGVVLMLGGNIPGVTRTLSIALYDQVQGGDFDGAKQISAVLLCSSLAALFVIYLNSGLRHRRNIDAV